MGGPVKVAIEVDLGIVEVETDSNHGNIDAIYFGSIDATNLTVAELISKLIPPQKWSEKIYQAEQLAQDEPDRMEDEQWGHPV